jgi:Acetyltransferase (GNAT) domain
LELSFRILRTPDEWAKITNAWEHMVARQSGQILGMDVTCTHAWALTLWENHLGRTGLEVLVAESGGELQAVVPFYRTPKTVHSVPCRCIASVTQLYSGRCGFLLNQPSGEVLGSLLKGLREHVPGWDVFLFTLVEGSISSLILREAAQLEGLRLEILSSQRSPYIVLDKPWDEYFALLPRKFRWNLRNFEKKMKAAGDVVHRAFECGADLTQFHDGVQEIEKASWKEDAGTSLTANSLQESFHARLMNVAADRRWFSGHILEFRGEPVAFVWGLVFGNIFYDFKESYKSSYRDFGPGHVLKLFLMEQLFKRGVAFYDYMGLCEAYKLRWTDKTYERSTFLLYNSTLAARAAQMANRFKKHFLARKPEPVPTPDSDS